MILLDKPVGWTSYDVVAWLRHRLGERRVGHTGTLDPLASGLLPVLVGPVTRLLPLLHGWSKNYVGTILLGLETPTGDTEGVDISSVQPAPLPPPEVIEAARRRLTGPIRQTPPVYSAKKVGGTPAHYLARRGKAPVLPSVPVLIHSFRVKPAGEGRLAFSARVSSGTYIRSLARDLGRLLGTGACLSSLRRTGIGPLRVRQAFPPGQDPTREELWARLLPPTQIPLPVPTVELDAGGKDLFRGGRAVFGAPVALGMVRILYDGQLEGLGEVNSDGLLQPKAVFRPASGVPLSGTEGHFMLAEDRHQG